MNLDLGDVDTIKAMIKYLYTAEYPTNLANRPLFHFHAQMYVVADFYDIASLRKRAEQMFEANASLLQHDSCKTAFFAIIKTLYTNDSANEERLRKIITSCASRAMPSLLKPARNKKVEILELIEEYPMFARDLVVASSALMENVQKVKWRLRCPICSWTWATAEKEDPDYYDSDHAPDWLCCPSCQHTMSWDEWEYCKVEGTWCQ